MKIILSAFDHSGEWCRPYREAGYDVRQIDLKHGQDIRRLPFITAPVHGILLAPPCQPFAGSGAQYWPKKDDNGETDDGLALVDAGLRLVALYRPKFWALENPVGRLPQWIGRASLQFEPFHFAGYLAEEIPDWPRLFTIRARSEAGEALTKEEVEFVKKANVYTKRTQLWGEFNAPRKIPVDPIRTSTQGSWIQLLGGKSERTKELRSVTPRGFALAFFEANP